MKHDEKKSILAGHTFLRTSLPCHHSRISLTRKNMTRIKSATEGPADL
jgi:hypothetical protein